MRKQVGQTVELTLETSDGDIMGKQCRILDADESWALVRANEGKKERMRKADPPGQREADQGEIRSCTNSRSIQIREPKLPVARRRIAGILCVFQDFSTQPVVILAAKRRYMEVTA